MFDFVKHGQYIDRCRRIKLQIMHNVSRCCWVYTFHSGQHSLVTFLFISTDAVAFRNAHFGGGIGTIHLDGVGCTGGETNLTDCSRSSTVSCFHGHSQDAGVRCQGLDK